MAERPGERDLETLVRDAGANLLYPATPDLRIRVRARLAAAPRPAVGPQWEAFLSVFRSRSRAPALAVAALATALVLGALVFSPDVRTAVAERLGLRAVTITHVPSLATQVTAPGVDNLGLGRRITLEQAASRVAYPILLPRLDGLEQPDAVFVREEGRLVHLSILYFARPGLPSSGSGEFGLLLTLFEGEDAAVAGKGLGPDTRVEEVRVGGTRGFWIEGTHSFFYRAPDGEMRTEGSRLAANTLLWERPPLTLRLETALPRDEALRIAVSVR